MAITYKKGDATRPGVTPEQHGLLVHVSNDKNGWGAGFVLAISKRWPEPEAAYRQWFRQKYWEGQAFELGNIQAIKVAPNLHVVNCIAQSGYGINNQALHQSSVPNSTPPIRYGALEKCLGKVAVLAKQLGASVFMPRIGTGLGGGSWDAVEPIIVRQLSDVSVTVYDFG
jgi:O-acetyl-ADP-ribose deacetylase (regulator of RNase III)